MNPELVELVRRVAQEEGVDPLLALALVQTESSFRPDVVSTAGAIGLAQVRLIAAADVDPSITEQDLFDPETNLRVGFRYLRQLEERFGSMDLALSAYNMGPTNMLQRISRGLEPDLGYRDRVLRNKSVFEFGEERRRRRTLRGQIDQRLNEMPPLMPIPMTQDATAVRQ